MTSAIGDSLTFIIAWTLIVFAAGFAIGRRGRDARDLSGPPPMAVRQPRPSYPAPAAGIPPEKRAAIEAALASGRKIEAIKLLREATGMGLKEAKDAVEDHRF